MTGTEIHAAIEQHNVDRATEALTRWRTEEQAATAGPWEFDGVDITQAYPAGYDPVVEFKGDFGWAGCDHRIAISDDDGAFIATARTAMPALLDVVEHVTSDDFARAVFYAAHETDLADWMPEDQEFADKLATFIRAAVAAHITPRLPAKES